MKNIRFIVFAIFSIASIAVPLSIIWKHEDVLNHGTGYRFRTAPVDPYDAFRGKYVALRFADSQATLKSPSEQRHFAGIRIAYVRLGVDPQGFAIPLEISPVPLQGDDVVTVENVNTGDRDAVIGFTYPFDRYYLEESIAPRAEQLYREANGRNDNSHSAYVLVKVKRGVGVLDELYIDGKPIRTLATEDKRRSN